jgi:predicted transcriptional regulator
MDLARPIHRKHRGYTGARLELMKKAASLSLEGATIPEIAKELGVSESTVRRLLNASEGLPIRYLSETAKVARLLDLDRLDGLIREFLRVATREIPASQEVSFHESLTAARMVLDVIEQRMKLLRYEDVPEINYRKLKAAVKRLLSE